MDQLSEKEMEILRYIRSARHKSTVREISHDLNLSPGEVETFVRGMLSRNLIRVVYGTTRNEDGYYTNPEKREEIYALLG
jgi:DNA-binding MarR family transcriptional regulator